MRKISIVTPCYNEELNVDECYEQVRALFEGQLNRYDHEHIFCDNSSTDGTVAKLQAIAERDKRVKIIVNSRNFGALANIFNGLTATSGDAVVVMLAADLQDPPAIMTDFVRLWEQGYEVVYGIRQVREENWLLRTGRRIFYRMVNSFSHSGERRRISVDRSHRRRSRHQDGRSLSVRPGHDRILRLQGHRRALHLDPPAPRRVVIDCCPSRRAGPERNRFVQQRADALCAGGRLCCCDREFSVGPGASGVQRRVLPRIRAAGHPTADYHVGVFFRTCSVRAGVYRRVHHRDPCPGSQTAAGD